MKDEPILRNQLERADLVELVLSQSGLVVIEAPTGWGKTVLAGQIAAASTTTRFVPTLDELSAALGEEPDRVRPADDPPALIVADGVFDDPSITGSAPPEPLTAALTAISRSRTDLVVICGRAVPDSVRTRARTFGPTDLAFTPAELTGPPVNDRARSLTVAEARAIVSTTRGWPLLASEIIRSLPAPAAGVVQLRRHISTSRSVEKTILELLTSIGDEVVASVCHAAHYEPISIDSAVLILGSSTYRKCLERGILLKSETPDVLEMAPCVRDALKKYLPTDADMARRLAPTLVAQEGAFAAARRILRAQQSTVAAEVLCNAPTSEIDQTRQADVLGLLRALRTGHAPHIDSRLLLCEARALHNLARLQEHRVTLDRAVDAARSSNDQLLVAVASTERLYHSIAGMTPSETQDELETLNEHASGAPLDHPVHTRLREIAALCIAEDGSLPEIYRSIDLLNEVASEWEALGEPDRAASTLRSIAAGPLNHIGSYSVATRLLERALGMTADNTFGDALTTELLGRFYALSCDSDAFDALQIESTALAEELGLSWLQGYVHWARMLSCVPKRDVEGARTHHRWAESLMGEILRHSTGAIFYAESASAFAVLEAAADAETCLAMAQQLTTETEHELDTAFAELVVTARHGDPARVPELELAIRQRYNVPHEREWRLALERTIADNRVNDVDPAEHEARFERAAAAAAEVGLTMAFATLKPTMVATHGHGTSSGITITLMGDFAVTVTGAAIDVPAGKVSALIKCLALTNRPLAVDQVIDYIWPDVDLTTGRRRLKNVVRRARALLGDETIVRQGNDIGLAADTVVDVQEFRAAYNAAITPTPPTRGKESELAARALALCGGTLLPTDLYEAWASADRHQLDEMILSLFDIMLTGAAADEDPHRAHRLLAIALRLGLRDEQLFVRLAFVALEDGREEVARRALARAQAITDDLGVPLTGIAGLEDLIE